MAKLYHESDCNLSVLDGKTVAVIGYGSQGHAQVHPERIFKLVEYEFRGHIRQPGQHQGRQAADRFDA